MNRRQTVSGKNYCLRCKAEDSRRYHNQNPDKKADQKFKKRYGITLDQYNEMLQSQNYRCAGCGADSKKFKRRLSVDHCHKTNRVRKLLCHACNTVLGLVNENIETLENLIKYLKET